VTKTESPMELGVRCGLKCSSTQIVLIAAFEVHASRVAFPPMSHDALFDILILSALHLWHVMTT